MTKTFSSIAEQEDEADRLLETGKLRRAERLLKAMLAKDPNCLAAHFQLARVYWRTEDYKCALFHSHRTLRINPKEAHASMNLGLTYEFMGKHRLAVRYYKRELSRDPSSGLTLFNIGRLYYFRRRWLQASKYLRRCFDLGFTFEMDDTVYKLGEAYYHLRDVGSFTDVYSRYLEIFPSAPWAAFNLGRALVDAKDYTRAVLWLRRANQLKPRKNTAVELARAKTLLKKETVKKGLKKRRT